MAEDLQQLKETVLSAHRLEPFELILVTPDSRIKRVYQLVQELGNPKIIQVLSVSQANKRRQLCRAIPEVETKITLLLDDDVWLPEKFSKWLLAPFEDPRMGGVGTNQQLRRVNRNSIWEFLGAMYLVRRNFDCTACNWIDGGLPCLSGRAVAYRSEILQDPKFTYGFTHETWGSDHFLNADDDNFITRWLFNNNWKIQIQNHRECEVETTLESDSKYLRQCLRWVRSNWRSNLTSLADMSMWMYVLNASPCLHIFRVVGRQAPAPPSTHCADHLANALHYRNYPWSLYAVFQTTLTQWAFPLDCLLLASFHFALSEAGYYAVDGEVQAKAEQWQLSLFWGLFLAHLVFAKTIKLIPHLLRNPGDVRFIPVSVAFGYFHNLIKLYGCITVTEVCILAPHL